MMDDKTAKMSEPTTSPTVQSESINIQSDVALASDYISDHVELVKSAHDVIGVYYPWKNVYDGTDRIGYFVSYQPVSAGEAGGLVVATDKTDILGVTVSSAGYSGNYAKYTLDGIEVGREHDQNYGLVAFSGIVNVRCTGNIPIGGRVVVNEFGMAQATENQSGFLVLAKGNNSAYDFVTIYLGVQMDVIARLRSSISDIAEFTEEDRQRLEDAVTSQELATVLASLEFLQSQGDAMNSTVSGIYGDIDNIKDLIDSIQGTLGDTETSMEQIEAELSRVYQNVSDTESAINNKVEDARKELTETIEDVRNSVSSEQEETMRELSILADNLDSISGSFREGGIITEMQEQIDENSAKLSSLVAGNLPDIEGLTQLKQQVDENGGLISSLVLDILKYSVGEFSQTYGMSYDDAVSILVPGILYVPIVAHTENLIRDALGGLSGSQTYLSAGTLDEREASNEVALLQSPPMEALEVSDMQTYQFEVLGGLTYRYIWDGTGWVKSDPVLMSTNYFEYDGTPATTDMWYCWQNVEHIVEDGRVKVYEAGTLYAWREQRWVAVAHVNDNVTARSINSVRQTAQAFSIQLQDLEGNFSLYEQTVDKIRQVVGGVDGEFGSMTVAKDGLYGEVFNPAGTAATLRGQVDSVQAMIDLIASGYYHRLEQSLAEPAPSPVGSRYSVRPQWSASKGKFVFIEAHKSNDGMYYFFDPNQTHYCKRIGECYEVYTVGDIVSAGTDVHISDQAATVDMFASFDTGNGSTLATIRNQALEDAAKIDLIASMSTDALVEVVSDATVVAPINRYTQRPTWNNTDDVYMYDTNKLSEDGLYYADDDPAYYCKLIPDGNGGYLGYERYTYDSSAVSTIVQKVGQNESSIGLIVDNGKVKGGIVIDAINGETTTKISGDKLNIKGITTVSNNSGSNTVIDGGSVTLKNIRSTNYTDTNTSDTFSTSGTKFDFSAGTISSKNFAIDNNGNAFFKGQLSGASGVFRGELQVGLQSDGETYNFVVDASGNVTANSGLFKGTLDAKDLKVNGKSILNNMQNDSATSASKIKADYLELKGLTITDKTGKTTFVIDPDGNVSVNGDITLGSGSKISWGNVTEKPEFADVATSGDYGDLLNQPDIPELPGYIESTQITSAKIVTPEIYANNFVVCTPDGSTDTEGKFAINGNYETTLGLKNGEIFAISYAAPSIDSAIEMTEVSFNSDVGAWANWEFDLTKFYGTIDFTAADVKGVTAVFG